MHVSGILKILTLPKIEKNNIRKSWHSYRSQYITVCPLLLSRDPRCWKLQEKQSFCMQKVCPTISKIHNDLKTDETSDESYNKNFFYCCRGRERERSWQLSEAGTAPLPYYLTSSCSSNRRFVMLLLRPRCCVVFLSVKFIRSSISNGSNSCIILLQGFFFVPFQFPSLTAVIKNSNWKTKLAGISLEIQPMAHLPVDSRVIRCVVYQYPFVVLYQFQKAPSLLSCPSKPH